MTSDWYLRPWVLLTIVLVTVIGLSPITPLFDVDEGAFTEATREMLASGNWVSTYLNGVPRHDKPILIYWLQALSATVLGFNEFALRMPSILAAFCWIGLAWDFARREYGERAAGFTVWVMVGGWLTPIIFKAAIADALLNALLCGAFFSIYRWTREPSTRGLLAAGVFMGLAFLTKGPIALALPLGTACISLALVGRLPDFLRAALHPTSWMTVLIIVVPWHVASYLDQGTAFFEGFYLEHNIGRFSETMESHGGDLWYYLLMAPLILLPWIAWLPQVLVDMGRALRHREDFLSVFLTVWFLLTFFLFSLSNTQLPHYLLYGLTPVFLMLARQVVQRPPAGWWPMLPGLVLALAFATFPVITPFMSVKNAYLSATLSLGFDTFLAWLPAIATGIAMSIGALTVLVLQRSHEAAHLVSALILALSVNFVALPIVGAAQQGPVKAAGEMIKGLPTDQTVVAWMVRMPSVSVYADRIIPDRPPEPGHILFTRINKVVTFEEQTPDIALSPVFQQGGIVLLNVETLDGPD